MKNYFGPRWIPKCLFKPKYSEELNGAAYLHDKDYDEQVGRYFADNKFLINCLYIAGKDKEMKKYMYLYYWLLRWFGWISYYSIALYIKIKKLWLNMKINVLVLMRMIETFYYEMMKN